METSSSARVLRQRPVLAAPDNACDALSAVSRCDGVQSRAATPLGKTVVPAEPAARLFDALSQPFKVLKGKLSSSATEAKVRAARCPALLNACSRNPTGC